MNGLSVGQHIDIKRTFTQSDFDRFAALSGDNNPIHVDADFSARTKFGRTVAHGMFLYSALCGLLGTHLPGAGMRQLEQELMFPNPTFTGEENTLRVEVTEIIAAAGEVLLDMVTIRPDGEKGLQGKTRVQLPIQAEWPAGSPAGSPAFPPYVPVPPSTDETGPFKGMVTGQKAETRRRFTVADLAEYADLAQDANPLHSDVAYARSRGFDHVLIPGALIAAMFSNLLGMTLPGQGTNYLKQRLQFVQPAYAEEELTASVEVSRIRSDKQLVNLTTLCTNPGERIVCQGEALVMVSDLAGA